MFLPSTPFCRCDHEPARLRSRIFLDAVHREPPVQGGAAHIRVGAGHALHRRRRPQDPRRHRRAVVRERRAIAGRRSSRRSSARPGRSTTRRSSRWGTPASSARRRWSRRSRRPASIACSSAIPGSEAVDTALKIALAYHRARGEGHRNVLIGRERGYHGVGFGGISVGGIPANRKALRQPAAARRSPAPHPQPRAQMAFSPRPAGVGRAPRRRPGAHRGAARRVQHRRGDRGARGGLDRRGGAAARATWRSCARSATSTGSCSIFDEVITGFGRTGQAFAAQTFGVTPDMITFAKGVTSGAVPMARGHREPRRSTIPW